jgi:hypothetical protein
VDGVDEGVAADVAEPREAMAIVDELVPAAEGVAVEQPLLGPELRRGEEFDDDALSVIGDAPAPAVGIRDAQEVGVEAHEEALGGKSHGKAPRTDGGST